MGTAAAPAPVEAGAPGAGVPEQPAPGVPDEPRPGGGGVAPTVDGPSVTLAGTIEIENWKGGEIRIDVFNGDQRAAAGASERPSVVAMGRVAKPGPFSVTVPISAQRVWIGAFADENGDGRPGHTDPSGWYAKNPVPTDDDADGLLIKLSSAPPPPGGGLE